MYERDLKNKNNDAAFTAPLIPKQRGVTTTRSRSQVTRDGTTSLKIKISRRGMTNNDRGCAYVLLGILSGIVLVGIVVIVSVRLSNAAVPSICSIPASFVALAAFFLCTNFFGTKMHHFTEDNVNITKDIYCLTQKNISLRSFVRILFVPAHFDDLESGRFVETDVMEFRYVRQASLQAEVLSHEYEDSEVVKRIKLGSITVARGLPHDEVEWLAEEINHFLQETN